MRQLTYEQLSFVKTPVENFLVDSFSADGFCMDKERKKLEQKYAFLFEITDRFKCQSVSYQLSKKDVLDGWLKYKEGFSSELVNSLLDEMEVKPGEWIMDPFMGSGTTALVCRTRGINSIGFDILPVSAISLKAKADVFQYDMKEIKALLPEIDGLTVPPEYTGFTPCITITQDAYPEENGKFLQYISERRDGAVYSAGVKNLLTLCIVNSLE